MDMDTKVFTVQQFCDNYQIGRNLFYKMVASGTGPALMKVGRRTLISLQAANEWRERVERETAELGVWSSVGGQSL